MNDTLTSPAPTPTPTPVPADAARRRWLLAGMAAAGTVALGAGGYSWWHHLHEERQLHGSLEQALWAQHFEQPGGGSLAMQSFTGKPLVLNFWATWCPPCVVELPLLNRFHAERQAQGWQVLGLAIDKVEAVRQFLGKLPLAFPVAMAGEQGTELARMLGNLQGGLPFTVVFDANGQITHRKIGQIKEKDLERWAT